MKLSTRVKSNTLGAARAVVKAAGARAVVEVAEDMLTEANDRVPLDEGDLARSGEVTAFPEQSAAAVTYDTPYAVKQHEDPTLKHPRQGEPYWLERTAEANAERYFQHIADVIRAATS